MTSKACIYGAFFAQNIQRLDSTEESVMADVDPFSIASINGFVVPSTNGVHVSENISPLI